MRGEKKEISRINNDKDGEIKYLFGKTEKVASSHMKVKKNSGL
jgi:hypothetical protein